MSFNYTFKIITAGEGSVGKTTMLMRYVEGKFDFETKMTIGVDIMQKNITFEDGKTAALQLWDFGGQERFRFFLDSFVMGANGAFLMFDLTRHMTFEKLEEWLGIVRKNDPNLPILLLGSKSDLVNDIIINDELAIEMKKEYNFIDYIKVSSKTNEKVDEAFHILTEAVRKYMQV